MISTVVSSKGCVILSVKSTAMAGRRCWRSFAVEIEGIFQGECFFVCEYEITKTLRLLEDVEWLE